MNTDKCPTCNAPAKMTWSGLDLVAESGDETLASKHYEYQPNDNNTLLAVSGFDWNQYRSTIWLANAHVNDERFLKPEKIGVLVADIKKLLHIIHEAQEAACASGGVDTVAEGEDLTDEEYRKKNSISNVSGVGIQKP